MPIYVPDCVKFVVTLPPNRAGKSWQGPQARSSWLFLKSFSLSFSLFTSLFPFCSQTLEAWGINKHVIQEPDNQSKIQTFLCRWCLQGSVFYRERWCWQAVKACLVHCCILKVTACEFTETLMLICDLARGHPRVYGEVEKIFFNRSALIVIVKKFKVHMKILKLELALCKKFL